MYIYICSVLFLMYLYMINALILNMAGSWGPVSICILYIYIYHMYIIYIYIICIYYIYIYHMYIIYIYIYVYAILHICIYLFFLILFLFFRRPGVCAAWQRLRPRPPPDFHDARNASLPSVPRCAAAVVETA